MATKDERPGLLSKVAMFVRNPTKDWSELDQPQDPAESVYDKQALKAMIERKRQNDFVRKREFDQLRKLRNRDPAAIANMARPSYFQSSLPSDADGRAITLKKIDEIEAQMSKQWWKGKQEAAAAQGGSFPVQQSTGDSSQSELPASQMATQGPSVGPELFEPTEAISLRPGLDHLHPGDYPATQVNEGAAMPRARAPASGMARSDMGFSTSELFAIEADDIATDPELEEAAIRFANGDDAGAEKGLLEALRGYAIAPQAALSWVGALLDLYRATNQHAAFERAVQEFALRFDKVQPQWVSLADVPAFAAGAAPTKPPPRVTATRSELLWDCPPLLGQQGMEDLREALSSHPMPWHISWRRLQTIDADAMPLLDGLFVSLCDEPVSLQVSGGAVLVKCLRSMTPSGDRDIPAVWWQVRLNALRAVGMHDEFELAALDYCVTHEVAPPAWEAARCQVTAADEDEAPAFAATQLAGSGEGAGAATLPMGLEEGGTGPLELRGNLLGDLTQVLADLDAAHGQGGRMVVGCVGLIRVDFSAAGSILNWVAQREADGRHVQFHGVQRLVAAFFNVIGINEHARVVARPM